MIRIGKKEKSDKLYQAILQLKDPQECYDFFHGFRAALHGAAV